jgi:cation:H+ antiporter
MLTAILQACAGLALLFYGGEYLVRGAVAIAHKFGMSSLSIGLTVVAFATSAPELAVSVSAALDGAPEIAVGNVVGSNIANIGLILGLSAVISPLLVENKVLRIDAPIMLGAACIMCLFLADDAVNRLEGLLLGAGLVAYILYTLWDARAHPEPTEEDVEVTGALTAKPIYYDAFLFILGLGMLIGGGRLLVTGAVQAALLLDISQAVIGLTVVAVGTSLPELATTLVAARKGYGDMAVGNIVGSNIFNTFGILGITSLVHPPHAGVIGWPDMVTLILLSGVVMMFMRTHYKVDRREGLLMLAGYAAYTGWLVIS